MDTILLRYSEIALKGKNRVMFERRLVRNIRDCLIRNDHKFSSISRPRGRIVISTDDDVPSLAKVFGISSYSPSISSDADIPSIKHAVSKFFGDIKGTFRVSVQRIDKSFVKGSLELEKELGSFVVENTTRKVSLKSFDTEIGVDIVDNKAYVFCSRVKGFGGLPLGIGGSVVGLIRKKSDLLSAWLMMKRGIRVLPVAFENVDIGLITRYDYGIKTSLKVISSKKELLAYMKKVNSQFIVVGDTINEYKDSFPAPCLLPMISYTGSDIDGLENRIR